MKTLEKLSSNSPTFSKILDWSKLIAITGSAQVFIQALGFLSGILIIRVLPVHEYALYTLANTMLGTLTILADGGIATGAMALGGKVWKDKDQLGTVLSTGMDLRRKFAIGSLLLATPFLIYLLRHHEASWIMTVLIVLSLIPSFFSALTGSLLQIPARLQQDVYPLQRIMVGINLGRLGLLLSSIFIFPWAYIAILAAGLPQIWANIQFKKITLPYINWTQSPDNEIKKEMLVFVKRILPGAIYHCLSGQITIILISIFGSTTEIAELGALFRISLVLTVFSALFGILITPRFARLQKDRYSQFRKYIEIHLSLLLIFSFFVFIVYIFPHEILWIIGEDYQNLQIELLLTILATCINLAAGISYDLSASKGLILNPLIRIPISVFSIFIAAITIDISSLQGILVFNLMIALVQLMMNGIYGGIKIINKKTW